MAEEKKPDAPVESPITGPDEHHAGELLQQLKATLSADTQELLTMLKHPRRFFWLNFMMGVVRGLGIFVGATILGTFVVAFFLILLRWMERMPLLGDLVRFIVNLIRDLIRQPVSVP
ncbi:MAG TPA: DUF5665 domain-containing protein [bacterium]|uniref:Uncharacterized protein n=1 Tax=candidate division TA06 bacterium ADurb.Bin417 TaxID=1852828 RepID=A0A1V5MIJ0_UNCT6|nr:MAG: hypothetical protein BWY73_00530 [candidate division TA06 bacterium ADurb.Bin417]HNS49145.1 DUF5665 domain-containing protein [bacterium]